MQHPHLKMSIFTMCAPSQKTPTSSFQDCTHNLVLTTWDLGKSRHSVFAPPLGEKLEESSHSAFCENSSVIVT